MDRRQARSCVLWRNSVAQFTLLCLVMLGLGVVSAFGQATATINGAVSDSSGAVIPGAQVTVTNTQTGQVTNATTADNGTYVVPLLAVGTYTLTFSHPGFKSLTREGVTLDAAQAATVNATLTVGEQMQRVEVTANAEVVQTGTATLENLITQRAIVDLPLNGRNPATLVFLSPGVVNISNTSAGVNQGYVTNPNDTGGSAGGGRQGSTYYMLDGQNSMDNENLLAAPFPNADATQEFQVLLNNFQAQYGFTPAAVVSVVTKSGTNAWHGDGFEFLRNYDLDARNFFTHTRDALKRNQFGGSIGGPIVKDKLFIFGDYQRTTENTAQVGSHDFVPNNNELNGDFTDLYTGTKSNPCGTGGPTDLNYDTGQLFMPSQSAPLGSPFVCPSGANAGQTVTLKQPIPGNLLAGTGLAFSSVATQFEKSMPKTDAADGGIYLPAVPLLDNTNEFTIRSDYNASEKQRIFGRVFYQKYAQPGNGAGGDVLASIRSWDVLYYNIAGGYSFTISPTVVNTFNITYNRTLSSSYPGLLDYQGKPFSLATLGSAVNYPPDPPYPPGVNQLGTNGWGIGQNTNAPMVRHNIEVADSLTWTKGKHLLIFGADILKSNYQDSTDWQSSPRISFDGEVTGMGAYNIAAPGHDEADFLLGYANFFEQGGGEFTQNHITNWNAFAQDSIRLKPNLTVNVGVRWEPWIPATPSLGRVASWRPGQQSTRYPLAPENLVFPGDSGVSGSTMSADMTHFDPRLGIAWQPHHLGTTSVRAAFGMFASPIPNIDYHHIADVAPFSSVLDLYYSEGMLIPLDAPWTNFAASGGVSPFPNPQPFASLASAPPASTPFITPSTVSLVFDRNFVNPITYSWNLSIEHQLTANTLLTVAYVANETEHLNNGMDQNPGVNNVRINPNFGQVLLDTPNGTSSYNSLQVSVNKRFSHGFEFTSNYTYSKCLDNGTLIPTFRGSINDPYSIHWNRGLCDTNYPSVFVNSWVYQEPKLAQYGKFASAVLGSWEISGVWTFQSGEPFGISGGCNGSNNSGTLQGSDRGDLTGQPFDVHSGSKSNWLNTYFNPAAFQCNAVGTFGNSARNLFMGPGTNESDIGLVKNFPFKERYRLQFRWEMFNAFNHPNFGLPSNSVTSSNFGQITGLAGQGSNPFSGIPPRIMQAALKFYF